MAFASSISRTRLQCPIGEKRKPVSRVSSRKRNPRPDSYFDEGTVVRLCRVRQARGMRLQAVTWCPTTLAGTLGFYNSRLELKENTHYGSEYLAGCRCCDARRRILFGRDQRRQGRDRQCDAARAGGDPAPARPGY